MTLLPLSSSAEACTNGTTREAGLSELAPGTQGPGGLAAADRGARSGDGDAGRSQGTPGHKNHSRPATKSGSPERQAQTWRTNNTLPLYLRQSTCPQELFLVSQAATGSGRFLPPAPAVTVTLSSPALRCFTSKLCVWRSWLHSSGPVGSAPVVQVPFHTEM